ncbi:heme biosynthesis protein HemY [Pseudohoeflea suaedae]|uniref:Heme biosynthesis protein HemY n=1 Tax=Pseudohoeflea suaedae TaxID=877384 RepID=A0A4R5PLD3_9HYPH|nr:heme biosynthesis protein HemY [Pseudohoeflea suaedae]TDH37746.1 heme biosynthesis protein HemY [Pseudohoeflea suaedae]
MIKILFFVVLVLALAFGFAWVADHPGDLTLNVDGNQIEMSLMTAVAAIVSIVAAVMILWWIVKVIWTSPHMIRRYFRASRRDRGYQALSTGLIAAGAGDAPTAHKMTKRTKSFLNADQEPLIHLLEVQTALIEGRNDEARKMFEDLAEDPETRLLGLRGLYLEARRQGADEAARHYADVAAEQAPQLPWAGEAALSNRTVEGDWNAALSLLDKQRLAGMYPKNEVSRKRAVLLTARAKDKAEADPAAARIDALAALKLEPDFVPAALIAAQALFREDKTRRGAKLLESAWRAEQHPDIAEAYVNARLGDTPNDKLKRAQKLEQLRPNNAESFYAVARAALDARRFELAREKAEAASRLAPREGIYLLLADIEEAETGDQGRVRHWLSAALRAPRDPAWTTDGLVSEEWEPVSPVTGRLDAFEWKVPVARIGGTIDNREEGSAPADKAIASLPPLAAEEDHDDLDESDDEIVEAVTPVIEAEPVSTEKPRPSRVAVKPSEPKREPATAGEPAKVTPLTGAPEPKASGLGIEETARPATNVTAAVAKTPAADKKAAMPDEKAKKVETAERVPISQDKPVPSGAKSNQEPGKAQEEDHAFLKHLPDDPGIDETAEPETKQRFRLF